jgi:hypothetical protein
MNDDETIVFFYYIKYIDLIFLVFLVLSLSFFSLFLSLSLFSTCQKYVTIIVCWKNIELLKKEEKNHENFFSEILVKRSHEYFTISYSYPIDMNQPNPLFA